MVITVGLCMCLQAQVGGNFQPTCALEGALRQVSHLPPSRWGSKWTPGHLQVSREKEQGQEERLKLKLAVHLHLAGNCEHLMPLPALMHAGAPATPLTAGVHLAAVHGVAEGG